MQQFIPLAIKKVLPAILLNKALFYIMYKFTKNNECVVDVAYTVSHLVAAGVYANHFGISSFQNKFKLFLVSFWTLRLAGFLFYNRIYKGFHDPRYEAILHKYDKNSLKRDFAVFLQFSLQGFIVFGTSLPLYFLFKNPLTPIGYPLLSLTFIAIIMEGVADQQLERFKQSKKPPNAIMEQGLWKKSRHPNLFFDLVIWFSLTFASMRSIYDLPALLGPIGLYFVMTKLTIPLTERLMKKKRGDAFIDYEKRTNKLWPF